MDQSQVKKQRQNSKAKPKTSLLSGIYLIQSDRLNH